MTTASSMLPLAGNLVMADRAGLRWPDFTLTAPGFNFWRLAALPSGGVLALDRTVPQLGTVTGTPLQTAPVDTPAPGILRSCQLNPNPPQLSAKYPAALQNVRGNRRSVDKDTTVQFVALTAVDQQLALLSHGATASAQRRASRHICNCSTSQPASALPGRSVRDPGGLTRWRGWAI